MTAGWRSSPFFGFLARFNDAEDRVNGTGRPSALSRPAVVAALSVTALAVLVRLPFLGTPYVASDTTHYLEVAHSIFHGGFLDNLRPPGYEIMLALFELVGADPVSAVVTLQNVVGIALPAAVLLVGWRFFGPAAGIVAGILTAASPLMIVTEQFALADYLFGVLLFAAAAVLAEAVLRVRSGRNAFRLLVAAGVLFGLATLFRANGLLGFVAIPVAALVATRSWRGALRVAAVAIVAMVAVLAPWTIHNLIRFGNPSIATEGGISLYARAISYDRVPPSPDTPNGRIALSVYDTADFTKPHGELETTVGVFNALLATGKTVSEASSAMGSLAREAIFRRPDVYLENTLTVLGDYRTLYDPHTFTANRYLDQIITARNYFRSLDPQIQDVPGNSPLTRVPWQFAQSLTMLLYVLTLGGMLALALPFLGPRDSRLAAAVLLSVPLLGFVGGSLTAIYSPRYDVMFAPFVWVVAAAAATLLAKLVIVAFRERPWRRVRRAQA